MEIGDVFSQLKEKMFNTNLAEQEGEKPEGEAKPAENAEGKGATEVEAKKEEE